MLEPLHSPDKEDWRIAEKLLRETNRTGRANARVYIDVDEKNNRYCLKVIITAIDWPGLVDTVSGVLHEKGHNIEFLNSFSTRYDGNRTYGIVLAISHLDPNAVDYVRKNLNKMKRFIASIAGGGLRVRKVITIGFEKLELMQEIEKYLKKIAGEEEYREIVKPDGELAFFIMSRSEAYLRERSANTLARIVYNSHVSIDRLRAGSRGVQVFVENLRTKKGENLTGLSVFGYERDLSMDSVLEAIRNQYPDYRRKYDKQFSTEDGITGIRVEFFAKGQKPVAKGELQLFKVQLEESLSSTRVRTPLNIKLGAELFGRILIPKLIEEVNNSHTTQVYIFPMQQDIKGNLILLLAVVGLRDARVDFKRELSLAFTGLDDFELINFRSGKSPSTEIDAQILTIKAIMSKFKTEAEFYERLRSILEDSIGSFRDFDEGMRRLDRQKFHGMIDMISDTHVSRRFIREYYYSQDIFYRITTPLEKLKEELLFAHEVFIRFFEGGRKTAIKRLGNSVYICIVEKSALVPLQQILDVLEKFNPTLTRVDMFGVSIFTFNMNILNDSTYSELKSIYEKLNKEVLK